MKVVVFGATGVIGRAAVEQFAADGDGARVVAVSRRPLVEGLAGVEHLSLDLADSAAVRAAVLSDAFAGTTHVVYTALQEASDLVSGWHDPVLMAHNLRLFRNALEPLTAVHGDTLAHVSLLQGAKAYGLHLGRTPVPAKECAPRDAHENFYFLQEDALRASADGAPWSWTILRPQVVYGQSFGSPMNLLPAIGVYAAVERAEGRPLVFPGGAPGVHEAVDARLLARALAWAAGAPEARGEIFNVTNGDVFTWRDVWPAIADVLGMEVGPEPVAEVSGVDGVDGSAPQRLAETMPPRGDEWAAVVDRHGLRSPRDMAAFVGSSWIYADMLFGSLGGRSVPALLSTVKIRRAGFADCIDTEDMFRDWFTRFQERRLLPL
jgi:nucleoside-diphosphate-sugar epimerase